jgi:signal transduction histidine kinase
MTTSGDKSPASLSDSLSRRGAWAQRERAPRSLELKLAGGAAAPAQARGWALSCLDGAPIGISSDEVALIVSELVTNSVVHARVDASRELTVTAALLSDVCRITVSDPGSDTEPRLRASDPSIPGGLGLRIVDHLCTDWGTFRGADSARHVWCDIPAA